MSIKLFCGDCLEILPAIPDKSIDMIFVDLPYGTTYAKWDQRVNAVEMWKQVKRVLKDNRAACFTASQPFTSMLVASNPEWFRCEWIWNKVYPTNFANANHQPMKIHESVLVFSSGKLIYYPQKVKGNANHSQGTSNTDNYSETRLIRNRVEDDLSGMKFPQSIQTFPKHSSHCTYHPSQKPVELMTYFIETYSRCGETVLDFTMGSGSTGVSCIQSGRNFIGIEKDVDMFNTASLRLAIGGRVE